jgi:mannosidase alpha-like ER degradation enhancer 2
VRKDAIETTGFSTNIIALVSPMIEDVTIKDNSMSSEKSKQLMDGTRDTCEENIKSNYQLLLQENVEGSLEYMEETSSHENTPMDGNLAAEDTTENLEQGYIEVPTVEVAMLGETTLSTESIVSTYLDTDDSEIKEVVIEDKPGQRDSSPDVQPIDDIKIETSKNDNIQTQIPHDKEEINAISKTAALKLMIESVEALEDGKHIHGLGNQDEDTTECKSCHNIYNGEVNAKCQSSLPNPTAINDQELGSEQNERVVALREISGSVSPKAEHTSIETIYNEEGVVEKTLEVWNLEDNFAAEKEPEKYDGDLFTIAEVNGKDFTGLHPSSLDRHLIVNEVKVPTEVNGVNGIVEFDEEILKEILEEDGKENTEEGLGLHVDGHVEAEEGGDSSSNLSTTTPSTPLQLLEGIEEEAYIARDTQETMTNSQSDQSQRKLLEEYKNLKLEDGEILSNCMQLVGNSSDVGIISTDGVSHHKVVTNIRASDFTYEANQKEVKTSTAAAGFTAECNQAEVTAIVDMTIKEQHSLQTSTPGREADEETPLLQAVQNIGLFSSAKQHSQVDVEIPMTDIAVMKFKAEVEEESEKSPLLSPREISGGNFRIQNHSARNKKPFQSLMTEGEAGMWSPLKEPESPKNNIMASSPRSKEKQKPRSSLFTSCMCCATVTN